MKYIKWATSLLLFISALLAAFAISFPTYWMNLAFGIWMITWTVHTIFHCDEIHWQKPSKSNIQLYAAITFFLWSLISIIWSSNINMGLNRLATRASLFIIPLFILTGIKNKYFKLNFFLEAFIIGAFISTIVGLSISYNKANTNNIIKIHDIFLYYQHYRHHTHFGLCQCFALISMIYLKDKIFNHKKIYYYILLSLIYFLFLFTIYYSQARMALIIYILLTISIIFHFFWNKNYKIMAITFTIIELVIGFSGIKYIPRMQGFKIDRQDIQNFDPRYEQWRCAKMCIMENNKIIGVGIGDHTDVFDKIHSRQTFKKFYFEVHSAHNQWLDELLELGVIGCLLFISIFLGSLYGLTEKNGKELIINSTIMWNLYILIETLFFRTASIYLFILYIIAAYYIKQEKK